MPYLCAARATAATGGASPSASTSNDGASRKWAPSGGAWSHCDSPSVRCAGSENSPRRAVGIAIDRAWSISPRCSSRGVIMPPARARLLPLAPQPACAPSKWPGPEETLSSRPPYVVDQSPCSRRRRQNSQRVSLDGCHTTSSESDPGAGSARGGSGTELKALASSGDELAPRSRWTATRGWVAGTVYTGGVYAVVLIVGGLSERAAASTSLRRLAVTAFDFGSSGASPASGTFHTADGPKKRAQAGASSPSGWAAVRGRPSRAFTTRTVMFPTGQPSRALRPVVLSGSGTVAQRPRARR